ncbi:MAG: hypothetical protein M1832_005620 [Thelocarpon impressellum]|nr:MAG: hypothetical protein M1832_005620 [Thelocarpon impressellum]
MSGNYRFEKIYGVEEWVEGYRPGHFHPVHIGDLFKERRYEIVRKLGYGSFSTVWLAHDRDQERLTALKIVKANASSVSSEVSLHQLLDQDGLPGTEGAQNNVALQDHFQHDGPNGAHLCLVFEAMGPSVSAMLDGMRTQYDSPRKYRTRIAWNILVQMLRGLEFLQRKNIVHSDLNPGNTLWTVPGLSQVTRDGGLTQDVSQAAPVRRKDGLDDPWAPQYISKGQPLADHVDLQEGSVKIADFGCAFPRAHPPASPITSRYLRAPELILSLPFDHRIDIWSFGILVFEFFTGHPMFYPIGAWGKSKETFDDDHLLQMASLLGPIPAHLLTAWTRSSKYYDEQGRLFNNRIKRNPAQDDFVYHSFNPPLQGFFEQQRSKTQEREGYTIDDADAAAIVSVVRWTMQYDPSKRRSATELLQHPLFAKKPGR